MLIHLYSDKHVVLILLLHVTTVNFYLQRKKYEYNVFEKLYFQIISISNKNEPKLQGRTFLLQFSRLYCYSG